MIYYQILTFLVLLTASLAYINTRFLKLPNSIGLMVLSLLFSLTILFIQHFFQISWQHEISFLNQFNFSKLVFEIMLSSILFAGGLHTDYIQLRNNRLSIILFSLVSVFISTILIGVALYGIFIWIHTPISIYVCLLFGSLISPTDPIAVLSILNKTEITQDVKINIVGESLFNDGIGVVLFMTILNFTMTSPIEFHIVDFLFQFTKEAFGGLLLGIILGWMIYYLMISIDDYETEVLITIAAVLGGSWAASRLHISAPIAMVVAGVMTGYKTKANAMSDISELYVDKFWHLIDIILNSILFVLMGLKMLHFKFEIHHIWIGLLCIPLVLIIRYISLKIPYLISSTWIRIDRYAIPVMTWGGLRGGLSIAMALSLSDDFDQKNLLVTATYIIVLFSIIVQGLTIEKLANYYYKKK